MAVHRFPPAHRDKGAVWLGIWSNWRGENKGILLTASAVRHRTPVDAIEALHFTRREQFLTYFPLRFHLLSFPPNLAVSCLRLLFHAQFSCRSLTLGTNAFVREKKPLDVPDTRCDNWAGGLWKGCIVPPPVCKVCSPGDGPTPWHIYDEIRFLWKFAPHGCQRSHCSFSLPALKDNKYLSQYP